MRNACFLIVLLISVSLLGCLLPGKSRAKPTDAGLASVDPSAGTPAPAISTIPTTTFIPATPSATAMPSVPGASLRDKALAFLKTEPQVESFKVFGWDEYFSETYLAKTTGKKLDYEWFSSHASFLKQGGDGLPVIYWQGLPGCAIDAAQTQDLQYGPKWYDESGKRCFTVWLAEVYFNAAEQPYKVRINEVE